MTQPIMTYEECQEILRTTTLTQGTGVLHAKKGGKECFCALGVLLHELVERKPDVVEGCELKGHMFQYSFAGQGILWNAFLPASILHMMGLDSITASAISRLNDDGVNFKNIAWAMDNRAKLQSSAWNY